jgi:hypothetical protein
MDGVCMDGWMDVCGWMYACMHVDGWMDVCSACGWTWSACMWMDGCMWMDV